MPIATRSPGADSPDDLTARARIRDAAIQEFALQGFDASVRDITKRARVSPGLVRHHFGSKDALREECDTRVLVLYREIKADALGAAPSQTIQMLSQLEEFTVPFVYILRSVRDGSSVGRKFVAELVAETEEFTEAAVRDGVLQPSRDPSARARFLVATSLGALLVYLDLSPGREFATVSEDLNRLSHENVLPALELYTQGLLVDRSLLDEYLLHMPDPPRVADTTHASAPTI